MDQGILVLTRRVASFRRPRLRSTAQIFAADRRAGLHAGLHIERRCLDLILGQAATWLALLALASVVPSTLGFLGVYQLVAVAILVPFGLDQEEAIAYILVSQAVYYCAITFWGCPAWWKLALPKGWRATALKPGS